MPSALCPLPFLAGLCLLAGTVACDVKVSDGKASFGLLSGQATDEWTRQYPLTDGGRVEVVNINGPIVVSAGAPGTVEVHATITAKAMTDDGARDLLAKGKIQETIEPSRVHLETVSPPRGFRGSYEVRYDVKVPANAQMDLSMNNGSVKADGLSGKMKVTAVNGAVDLGNHGGGVDAVTVNGSLKVMLATVSAPVRLETTNGALTLQLPAASKANLSARVVNGFLTVSGLAVENPQGRRIRNLEAALNGGGPEVSLRATNGRIVIEGK